MHHRKKAYQLAQAMFSNVCWATRERQYVDRQIEDLVGHLLQAMLEVGEVQPWYETDEDAWIFISPLYPVKSTAATAGQVANDYWTKLCDFIWVRLNGNLDIAVEVKTYGKAGLKEPLKHKALKYDDLELQWEDMVTQTIKQQIVKNNE